MSFWFIVHRLLSIVFMTIPYSSGRSFQPFPGTPVWKDAENRDIDIPSPPQLIHIYIYAILVYMKNGRDKHENFSRY